MRIPRCRLRTLDFLGRHASPEGDLRLESIITLLDALPSLQSLCGKSRESHIRDWRDMHKFVVLSRGAGAGISRQQRMYYLQSA